MVDKKNEVVSKEDPDKVELSLLWLTIKNLTFSKALILIALFSFFGVVYEAKDSYDKKTWAFELINTDAGKIKKVKLKLAEQHKYVRKVIDKWNDVSDINDINNLDVKYVRDNILDALERYQGFESDEFTVRLTVSYLHHLAKMRIIYTDVYRDSSHIFIAENELNKALNLASNSSILTTDDIQFLNEKQTIRQLKATLVNAHTYQYIVTKSGDFKVLASEQLKQVGGCLYLNQKRVQHISILEVLGCQSFALTTSHINTHNTTKNVKTLL